jgi:hypothetical protein
MAQYKLEYVCEHVETITVDADNFKDAMYKFINDMGEMDWHLEGRRYIQSIEKDGEKITVTDKIQKDYSP